MKQVVRNSDAKQLLLTLIGHKNQKKATSPRGGSNNSDPESKHIETPVHQKINVRSKPNQC